MVSKVQTINIIINADVDLPTGLRILHYEVALFPIFTGDYLEESHYVQPTPNTLESLLTPSRVGYLST